MKIDRSKMTEDIKVNFSQTEEQFVEGYGEGMWVRVDEATKKAYDEDAFGGHYVGILDNFSSYSRKLVPGVVVHFEMRGELRPVAFIYRSSKKEVTQ